MMKAHNERSEDANNLSKNHPPQSTVGGSHSRESGDRSTGSGDGGCRSPPRAGGRTDEQKPESIPNR